jgi:glycosyltransferase 2 family protein
VSLLEAHLICVLLSLADFAARSWRIQAILGGLGHRITFGEAVYQSILGEAASSTTPLRLGGEPARLWAMTRLGIPATAGIVGIGIEFLIITPTVVVMGLVLGLAFAPEWWADVGPTLIGAAQGSWPWVAGVIALIALGWLMSRRLAPAAAHALSREAAAARMYARQLPRWVLYTAFPLTLISATARLAILPVLALTLIEPPPFVTVTTGSYALLYSQAILPMPAGVGAVELGFLGGAAGEMGAEVGRLLVIWRIYTAIIWIGLGALLVMHRMGMRSLIALLRSRQRG